MNTETEIESLKKEVARLRREMDEYRQFIHYHPPQEGDDGKPQSAYLSIRCTFLSLFHPSDASKSMVNIMCAPDGGFISLLGKDERPRLLLNMETGIPELCMFGDDNQYKACLRMDNSEPSFELYGKENKLGMQLKVVDEEGRGQVGVCEAGQPRAVMKATNVGAAISIVHDDGHARITMVGTPNNGELFAVTPDMKIGVKIAADGMDGGFITVNRANGKAGVILSNTAVGGTVIVQDQHGKITGHLPMIPEE
jgi:hypothetical protein